VAAPQAGEEWQTPHRAVFTLGDTLAPDAEATLHASILKSGLPVIERRQLGALTGEQDLIAQNRVDAQTAMRIGRLIGGHIALFVTAVQNRVEIRCVAIETGELIADALISPDQISAATDQALLAATAAMPARGVLFEDPHAGQSISLGSMHGVHLNDRFEVLSGTAEKPGPVLGTLVVTGVRSEAANVHMDVQAVPAVALPALVRRLAP
jgi:hypothetical protein